jgi:hypothetical protein
MLTKEAILVHKVKKTNVFARKMKLKFLLQLIVALTLAVFVSLAEEINAQFPPNPTLTGLGIIGRVTKITNGGKRKPAAGPPGHTNYRPNTHGGPMYKPK